MIVVTAVVVVYTFFAWLFTIETRLVRLDDVIVAYAIPCALSFVAYWMWLSPRVKALNVKDRPRMLYAMVAVATMAAPIWIAHDYLAAATGKLTHVKDSGELGGAPDTKYYSVDKLCVTKNQDSASRDVAPNGHGELSVTFYIVIPLCEQQLAAAAQRTVWIGFLYHTFISNRVFDKNQDRDYEAFLDETRKSFIAEDPNSYTYFEQVGNNSGDQRGFHDAVQKNERYKPSSNDIILIPHKDAFEARTGNQLTWIFASFGIGALLWLAMIFVPSLDFKQVHQVEAGENGRLAARLRWLVFFVPRRETYALPLLLDLNVLVFVAMVFSGADLIYVRPDDLLAWGANYRPSMHGLGWFRLLTSQFVHVCATHLINNLVSLFLFGMILQSVVGPGRLLSAYLLSGIGGGLTSIAVHPAVISVGASGGVFGLFGVLLILLAVRDEAVISANFSILALVTTVLGINLLLGFLTPGIDNAAHVGGLITGGVAGLLLHIERVFAPPNEKRQYRRARPQGKVEGGPVPEA
jgi:membrane associated rhomboid family serine protease